MHRRLLVAGVAALLASAILAGCGKKDANRDVVARVNGTEYTRGDVLQAFARDDTGAMLRELISRQLIQQRAKERGLQVTDEELNRRYAVTADEALAETGKNYEQWLKEHGQTVDTWKQQARERALKAKVLIPQQQEQAFFEAHKQELAGLPHNNEAVIYRRLVVATRAEAEALRQQLQSAKNKDADFARLAGEKSLDAMTRTRGGMAGWMIKGKAVPAEQELEKVLFALKPGEVSQPLPFKSPMMMPTGQPGAVPEQWQLVTVVKYLPPHPVRLEDNEDTIEGVILSGQSRDPELMMLANQALQTHEELEAKANIEIIAPQYKSLEDLYKQEREAVAQMPTMGGPTGQPGAAGPAPQAPPRGGTRRPAPGTREPAPSRSAPPAGR